jgi:hypothetical protein
MMVKLPNRPSRRFFSLWVAMHNLHWYFNMSNHFAFPGEPMKSLLLMPVEILSLALLLQFIPYQATAADDAITNMCLDSGVSDVGCNCSTEKLTTMVTSEQLELYNEVGIEYRMLQQQGMGRGDAWDAAVKKAAQRRGVGTTTILKDTNAVGRAHSDAMKTCSSGVGYL